MAETILQTYLDNSFIQITDTEDKTKLTKAATEVAKRLEKKRSKIISYSLVGIDPQTNENDPVFIEVEKIIKAKWSTFRNSVSATKDKPVNYIRIVILEALNKLVIDDKKYAVIIWNSCRNAISRFTINKKERTVLNSFLEDLSQEAEILGRLNWGIGFTDFEFSPSKLDLKAPSVAVVKVNRMKLQEHLQDASQYSGWETYGDGGSNPSPLNDQNWAPHFSEHASIGIAKEVNSSLKTQNDNLTVISNGIQNDVNSYFENLQPFFDKISTSMLQGVVANNKRTELLWWKEALYSRQLKKSYRDLTSLETAIAMAVDLSELIDPIYPSSVDYFLMETIYSVIADESNTVIEFDSLSVSDEIQAILESISKIDDGKKQLGVALANELTNKNQGSINEQTGLEKKSKITIVELSNWIFHDLQAIKLASTK